MINLLLGFALVEETDLDKAEKTSNEPRQQHMPHLQSSTCFNKSLSGVVEVGGAGGGGSPKKKGKMHGIEVSVEEILHARMVDAHGGDAEKWNVDPTAHGIYAEPQEVKEPKDAAKGKSGAMRQSIGFQFDVKDAMWLGHFREVC